MTKNPRPVSARVASVGVNAAHGPHPAVERTQGDTCADFAWRPATAAERGVLDASEVGHVLGVGRTKVYELDAREELPTPVQFSGGKRWAKAEIEAWILFGAPSRAKWARIWPNVRKELLRR